MEMIEHWARVGMEEIARAFQEQDHGVGWYPRGQDTETEDELIAKYLYACAQLGQSLERLVKWLEREDKSPDRRLRVKPGRLRYRREPPEKTP